ncbi:DNA-binding response regulator [Actinocatenispora thailandica]|uniref:DNA-binding response regulator n=1 Tax=Actinocatenispora thailandica TaxID=227318 RepID=A0A7R7DP12_9ACTN|nr:response regulator transcription factor [Actinocatenispora thailandica]BCJ35274.1 DNA-binding response regulator [Actinocatenispora thailandica]
MEQRPIRVVVADDQRVVREGIELMLSLTDGVEVVATAADGEQAVAAVARHDPDVVLMDLRMPRCDGVEATRRVRRDHPRSQVVVLTTFADDESVLAALRAGARGYLTKDAGADEVARAVHRVAAGQADLDPDVQRRLLELLPAHQPARPVPTGPAPDGLTDREAQVLSLIAAGLSNTEIAQALVVSEATVKTHVNHVFAKTGVRDRAQAVAYAYRHGLAG